MKNILVAVASKYVHSSLSVWYIKSAVENLDVYECTINQDINKVFDEIIKEKPDTLGFSCYIWNIEFVKKLISMIKKALPEVVIILGGPEVSHNPEHYNDIANCVICGFGEVAYGEILGKIQNGQALEKIVLGKAPIVVPNPYTSEYFKSLNGRIAYIETSRGCPFTCGFCLSGAKEIPTFFPIERAYDDILRLSQGDTQTIKFVDRTFNAKNDRAVALWKFIIEDERLPKNITYHFEIGADLLTREQLNILKSAPKGRIQLEVGIQSFNEKTLKEVNRAMNTKRICDNIKEIVNNGNMHIHTDLIIGLPYENLCSFKESFNKAYELKAHMLQVGFLKLLYGCKLRENMEKYSMECQSIAPYEITSFDHMDSGVLQRLHKFEDVVERMHNSGRFMKTIQYLLDKNGNNPFEVFFDISENLNYSQGCSLDNFTDKLFEHFNKDPYIRDVLVLDRLESNNTGTLSKGLKIIDSNLAKAKKALKIAFPQPKGVVRGVAILYGENKIAYCDYVDKDFVTNRYKANIVQIDL